MDDVQTKNRSKFKKKVDKLDNIVKLEVDNTVVKDTTKKKKRRRVTRKGWW